MNVSKFVRTIKAAVSHLWNGYRKGAKVKVCGSKWNGVSAVVLSYQWVHGAYIVRLNYGRGTKRYPATALTLRKTVL